MEKSQPHEQSKLTVAAPKASGQSRREFLAQHRFIFLFGVLLAFFVLMPLFRQLREDLHSDWPGMVETIVFIGVLGTVVVSISQDRRWKLLSLILGLPAAVLWGLPEAWAPWPVLVMRHLFALAFLAYAIASILILIFAARDITRNLLFAALCVYLLLGVLWALTFSLVEILTPGAFASGGRPIALRMDTGRSTEALYFSFTTLATLGYGDIVPTGPLARMLAVLEAVVGQLYLAVLVARLVGMRIAGVDGKKGDEGKSK